jgi:hypothetical protein
VARAARAVRATRVRVFMVISCQIGEEGGLLPSHPRPTGDLTRFFPPTVDGRSRRGAPDPIGGMFVGGSRPVSLEKRSHRQSRLQ